MDIVYENSKDFETEEIVDQNILKQIYGLMAQSKLVFLRGEIRHL